MTEKDLEIQELKAQLAEAKENCRRIETMNRKLSAEYDLLVRSLRTIMTVINNEEE